MRGRFSPPPPGRRPVLIQLPFPSLPGLKAPESPLQRLLGLRAVPTRDASGVDIEPYLRQVAAREGLDPDELLAEAEFIIDKYALLWDEMRADGRLQ